MNIFWIVLLLILLPAVIAGSLGSAKDRGGGIWFILGLIFSWFAVLIVACLSYPESSAPTGREAEWDIGGRASELSKRAKESERVQASRRAAWEDFRRMMDEQNAAEETQDDSIRFAS